VNTRQCYLVCVLYSSASTQPLPSLRGYCEYERMLSSCLFIRLNWFNSIPRKEIPGEGRRGESTMPLSRVCLTTGIGSCLIHWVGRSGSFSVSNDNNKSSWKDI
jgi:hypothetical protein